MKALRDAYHDYITHSELEDCGSSSAANALYRERLAALGERSGLRNVSGARFTMTDDHRIRAVLITAWIDSSSWTGRPR